MADRQRTRHRVICIPALLVPYVGARQLLTAGLPAYNAKDELRMGNYSRVFYVGVDVVREFLCSGTHSLPSRTYWNDEDGALHPEASR